MRRNKFGNPCCLFPWDQPHYFSLAFLNYLCSFHTSLRLRSLSYWPLCICQSLSQSFSQCYITTYKDGCDLRTLAALLLRAGPFLCCSESIWLIQRALCDLNVFYSSQTFHAHPNQIWPYREVWCLVCSWTWPSPSGGFALHHPQSQERLALLPCNFSYRIAFSSFLLVLHHRTYYLW